MIFSRRKTQLNLNLNFIALINNRRVRVWLSPEFWFSTAVWLALRLHQEWVFPSRILKNPYGMTHSRGKWNVQRQLTSPYRKVNDRLNNKYCGLCPCYHNHRMTPNFFQCTFPSIYHHHPLFMRYIDLFHRNALTYNKTDKNIRGQS